jgi:hypothetical protein
MDSLFGGHSTERMFSEVAPSLWRKRSNPRPEKQVLSLIKAVFTSNNISHPASLPSFFPFLLLQNLVYLRSMLMLERERAKESERKGEGRERKRIAYMLNTYILNPLQVLNV